MLRSRAGEIGTRRCSTPANNCERVCCFVVILLTLQTEAARAAAEAARHETLGAQAEEVRPCLPLQLQTQLCNNVQTGG